MQPWAQLGNINQQTYLVTSGESEALLQAINPEIFPDPITLMRNAVRWTEAAGRSDTPADWRNVEFLPSDDGHPWTSVDGVVWRLMRRIPEVVTYRNVQESPDPEQTAYEHGRALAVLRRIGRTISPSIVQVSFPGYRDTGHYLREWFAVTSNPPVPDRWYPWADSPEVELLRDFSHQAAPDPGGLVVAHGDTKLENFLFARDELRCVAVVDLDTVMIADRYMDWGDAMRSTCNSLGERHPRPDEVRWEERFYSSAFDGYIAELGDEPSTEEEWEMRMKTRHMIAEQALRFLTDYFRGDTYYRRTPEDPEDLNLTRALVQIRLLQSFDRATG